MRDNLAIELGGQEYQLRPTFAVWDEFEDTSGTTILAHLQDLWNGTATGTNRARLILLGLKAADPDRRWTIEAVKKCMFERGAWHEDLVHIESDFCQSLIYTPEQYAAKKAEREEAAKREAQMQEALAGLSGPSLEPLQPQ